MNTIRPIDTFYSGFRFRSRLEARWAVFFDALGVRWEYEKEGFNYGKRGYYLPDFWLPDFNFFAEIKPFEVDPYDVACKFGVVAFSGPPWDYRTYEAIDLGICDGGRWSACPKCENVGYVFCGWAGYIKECNCWDHPITGKTKNYKEDGTKSPKMLAAIGRSKAARFEHGEHG